ncbi:MAG: hypothetical protein CMH46_10915 [Muricauda sp.]|nr:MULTISPECIES: hypothetical protein [unclassified Allomuricauda]MAU16035.1 hypothetical protein [Allomuricauda sp.]|tara:strand:+ start:29944 stop:30339 length:396 start_codon:yes stop_codon:yes gene_type:complete
MESPDFIQAFESGDFPPEGFNHKAHIKLAWTYLNQFSEEMAIDKTCRAIQNFDRLHGDGTKYHVTLTVAAVKMVYHFKQNSNAITFEEFITEFPKLNTSFRQLLYQHYRKNVIGDPLAKTTYLAPDLLPFK